MVWNKIRLFELKILVYEYFTGGGLYNLPLFSSVLSEALGMLKNLISDFKFAGHLVTTILDSRLNKSISVQIEADEIIPIFSLKELESIIDKVSLKIDAAYIIAPETDEILQDILKIIKNSGIISLNCSCLGINRVYDKSSLYEFLKNNKVQVPESLGFSILDKLSDIKERVRKNFSYPIVIKPMKGAGCEGISIVQNEQELKRAISKIRNSSNIKYFLIQNFVKGIDASINLLSNGHEAVALSLNKQNIRIAGPDSYSEYLGGIVPLDSPFKNQAFEISENIVSSIKGLIGYIGIDLIITNNEVVVIEINPRLTTSYIGLRKVINLNLGQSLIDCVFKKNIPNEISLKGYIFFTKINSPHVINFLVNNHQIFEILSPSIKISGYKTTCPIVAIKSKTKRCFDRKLVNFNSKVGNFIGGIKF